MAGRIRSSVVDDVTIARALHVLAVVLWIGGVAFVTTVLLPAVRNTQAPADQVVFFENVERRFSGQARFMTRLPVSPASTWSFGSICGTVFSRSHIGGCTRWSQYGCCLP